MEITLAVMADAANISDSGKINLLGVFQSISSPAVPAFHPQMTVVVVLRSELGEKGTEHIFELEFLDADRHALVPSMSLSIRVPLDDPRPNPELPVIISLIHLPLPQFGNYEFEVKIDGRPQKTIQLLVQPLVLPPEE